MMRDTSDASEIGFQFEISVPEFGNQDLTREWILQILESEGKIAGHLAFRFVDDRTLHELNVHYLDHDTLTDILTFPYTYEPISADIVISVERTRENARLHNVSSQDELYRVIIHGVYHMCGWNDHEAAEREKMRELESRAIREWKKLVEEKGK